MGFAFRGGSAGWGRAVGQTPCQGLHPAGGVCIGMGVGRTTKNLPELEKRAVCIYWNVFLLSCFLCICYKKNVLRGYMYLLPLWCLIKQSTL